MSDWQPIETAPKDGTEVLLAAAGAVFPARFASTNNYSGGWFSWNALLLARPTHWMPLPEPPAESSTP